MSTLPTLTSGIPLLTGNPLPSFPPAQLKRFRILRPLGRGGMGMVYLAADTLLQREVAIKFVLRPTAERIERFRNEARTAARLQHENIVSIYELDELDGLPYLVEEYVPGTSLAALSKPVPLDRVHALATGLARGLAHAHECNIIHGDIAPGNVLITEAGLPKLLDFGLARFVGAGAGALADTETAPGIAGSARPAAPTRPICGTPHYMAPELWHGDEAGKAADVYALGVVLYELCTGHVPFRDVPLGDLGRVLQERDPVPLEHCVPPVHGVLPSIIDRCLARDPERRFADGEALWSTLVAARTSGHAQAFTADTEASPYPGLRPFASVQRSYFFGRDDDIATICERLRQRPMVLVAGESGVGKSSLAHAGVLPRLTEPMAGGAWTCCALVPGRHPLTALSAALSRRLDADAAVIEQELRADPDQVVRRLERARGLDAGTILFVDQLEELLTAESEAEAAVFSAALAHLATRSMAVRVLATLRGDKIAAFARLPGLGARVQESLHLLLPLGPRELRTAAIRPAGMHGFHFESESMVDELVTSTLRNPGGLPLLQFTLAQLWEYRDSEQRIIPRAALNDIGGVEGALSRHADRVVASLLPPARSAARRILLRLVSVHGSRDRYSEAELVAGDGPSQDALDALVRERLVVVRDIDGQPVYELAHESLLTGWPTLRQWLDEASELHARRQRLATSALQWDREGRPRDLLWRGRRRRDIEPFSDDDLTPVESAFRYACRRLARREQLRIFLAAMGGLLVIASLYGFSRYLKLREIDGLHRNAKVELDRARNRMQDYRETRSQAIQHWYAFRWADAEKSWRRALILQTRVETSLRDAIQLIESALRPDPTHAATHRLLAKAIHEQATMAAMLGRTDEIKSLVARMSTHDDAGAYTRRWLDHVPVTLTTSPPGRPFELYKYTDEPGASTRVDQRGTQVSQTIWSLPPGTYLAVVPGDEALAEVRFPFHVAAGQPPERPHIEFHIDVPRHQDVPEGFVYVPAGTFLFGFGGDERLEPVRTFYSTLPLHELPIHAFLIARNETTYAEWIEFLRSLPPDERTQHLPRAALDTALVELTQSDDDFQLRFRAVTKEYSTPAGQPFHYPDRDRRASQDWLKFPVTGISVDDALAFMGWLDSTGRVPGARLCREDEWERAARGADARLYPHANELEPEDANHDATYAQLGTAYGFGEVAEEHEAAFGFDEVGQHARSRSPFGVNDMVGNAREMVRSILAPDPDTFILRSGSFFHEPFTNAMVNREILIPAQRIPHVGLRVCADAPQTSLSLQLD